MNDQQRHDALMGAISEAREEARTETRAVREETIGIGVRLKGVEERAGEDRRERKTQITVLHERVGEENRKTRDKMDEQTDQLNASVQRVDDKVETVAGDQRETAAKVEAHIEDENRHQGIAPGNSAAKTAGYAGGSVVGVFAFIEYVLPAIKSFMGG